jgi:hypothetical protein
MIGRISRACVALLIVASSAQADVRPGQYLRKLNADTDYARLDVFRDGDPSSVRISLLVEYYRGGNKNDLLFTGELERARVTISGDTAVYDDASLDEPVPGCKIEFKFHEKTVTAQQTGECIYFGYGVNASGTYYLQEN